MVLSSWFSGGNKRMWYSQASREERNVEMFRYDAPLVMMTFRLSELVFE